MDDDHSIRSLYRLWTRDKSQPTFAELVLDNKTLYRYCVVKEIERAQSLLDTVKVESEFLISTGNAKLLQSFLGHITLSLSTAVRTLKKLEHEKFLSDIQLKRDYQTINNIRDQVLKFVVAENLQELCKNRQGELQ